MANVVQIISDFGGPSAFASAIGIKPSAASEMKRRKSIPVSHWPKVIKAARQRGLDLTSDILMTAHAPEKERA